MPHSRNTRIRPKNTSRAEARRRHREESRAAEVEPNTLSDQVEPIEMVETKRSMLAMPNVVEDLKALPQVFRKPLVWLPFGLLLLAFGLEMARQGGALPEGQIGDIATLYIQLTLPPTSLFVFFIGGFVATRASYLVGALLGIFDATLITLLVVTNQSDLEGAGMTSLTQDLVVLWSMAIVVGVFAAGFAAWYRRFLRSSQERAKANRIAREQEQARKAKEQARADREQARADKYAAQEARRKSK